MMNGVIVIGAGGHAKVCIELLRAMERQVAFCIGGDDDAGGFCLGVPVLAGDAHLASLRDRGFGQAFVAIGSNGLRQRLGARALALGFELVNAISPRATLSPTAQLGRGVAVMAGAIVNADSRIADFAIINTAASVDHDGHIGEAAHIAPHCGLAGNVEVGARSFLGIGTKVIPGIVIGPDVVAGAGSVIVSDVAGEARIAGVPARTLRKKDT
ncbi:UDP-perosamine 4-acetyltransferase [Burkholderiales bacterium 8X]|nr:UDP-perosamine 4-acetyltransferase [Burkholderiales bacterium 8X]